MSLATVLPLVLKIVDQGLVAWNQGRAARFKKKYHKLMGKLRKIENKLPPDYTDADRDLLSEELETFLKAYYEEFKEDNTRKYS